MKGKKYPQPVDTYIGVITPDGVIESRKKKVSLTDVEVWEYGFSKAVWELCPDDWKKSLGDDWEDVLSIILKIISDILYPAEQNAKKESELHCQFAAQTASLSHRIYNSMALGWKSCISWRESIWYAWIRLRSFQRSMHDILPRIVFFLLLLYLSFLKIQNLF